TGLRLAPGTHRIKDPLFSDEPPSHDDVGWTLSCTGSEELRSHAARPHEYALRARARVRKARCHPAGDGQIPAALRQQGSKDGSSQDTKQDLAVESVHMLIVQPSRCERLAAHNL